MAKGKTAAVLPPLKPAGDMTDADRTLLAALKVGTGDEFNMVITSVIAFYNSDGWTERKREKVKSGRDKKQTYEILWEQKKSSSCDKTAARFTVTVPDMTMAAFEHVMGDDWAHRDTEDTMQYKFDKLVSENGVEATLAGNLSYTRACYRSPIFTIGPREFHCYLSYLNLLDAGQQQRLGVVPRSAAGADLARAASLRVLVQCVTDAGFLNRAVGAEAAAASGALPVLVPRKKHVVGVSYNYLVMGQEEADGSFTITFLVDMDLAGSLPVWAADMAITEQLEKVRIIARLCEEAAAGRESFVRPYENTREFFPVGE